eukprot:CAMPEP_0197911294 /NCGR_PEP_ID=MMETSP1439-20131203/72581_1 /TAXON_ID=66791 /ORGANISM="Gonyaulax spinifera, Strain CCMP409" /LENGTH=56 /DNA_ID=CAMNT_0043533021 /DNA_START=50 /DNA_END=216 /DNA_ORIENTATION=-
MRAGAARAKERQSCLRRAAPEAGGAGGDRAPGLCCSGAHRPGAAALSIEGVDGGRG